MKKSLLIIMALLVAISSAACWNDEEPNGNGVPEELKAADFFPMKADAKMVYEGMGNEYASYVRWTDFIAGTRIQSRQNNGGSEIVRVIDVKDGKAVMTLERGETYFREDMTGANELSEIVIQEPIQVGNKWSLGDSRTREITSVKTDVDTPSGKYECIEITTSSENDKVVDYYAKGIGLVRTEFRMEGEDVISSSLKEIVEGSPFTQTVSLFYPNLDNETIYYKDVTLSFVTNDRTGDVLAKAYRENGIEGSGRPFSPNTSVNSLHLAEDGIVNIDLNGSFISEMNAGAMYEGMILQSVANTFGKYYEAEEVIIKIDGQLYESGHFAFQEGETLKTNVSKSVHVK